MYSTGGYITTSNLEVRLRGAHMMPCPGTEFYPRFGLSSVYVMIPHFGFALLPVVQAVPRRKARAELRPRSKVNRDKDIVTLTDRTGSQIFKGIR